MFFQLTFSKFEKISRDVSRIGTLTNMIGILKSSPHILSASKDNNLASNVQKAGDTFFKNFRPLAY